MSVLWLIAAGALLSIVTLTLLRVREGRTQPKSQAPAPAPERGLGPGLAFDEPTS
jgi:hypothetical protein